MEGKSQVIEKTKTTVEFNPYLKFIWASFFQVNKQSMVVKIAIWIVRSHDFTIPPHQND